jgi:hypothetical protein
MGLLFAFALLCIPLAFASWDLAQRGQLKIPERAGPQHRSGTTPASDDEPASLRTRPEPAPLP